MDEQDKNKNTGLNDPALVETQTFKTTCPNCKQKVEPVNMMCPECQHYIDEGKDRYQPLSDKTKRKVRLILTIVLVAAFILMVYLGVVRLDACENMKEMLVTRPPSMGKCFAAPHEFGMTGLGFIK